MTLIVDAAPLVALADSTDRMHKPTREVLAVEPGELIIPAAVSAEVDYLLGVRHGKLARRQFLADLAAGRSPWPSSNAPTTIRCSTSKLATRASGWGWPIAL